MMFVVLSLSLFVGLFAIDIVSFLSQALGKPKPVVVWVSPCDSSSQPRTSTSTRSSSSISTSRFCSRTCFFPSPTLACWVWVLVSLGRLTGNCTATLDFPPCSKGKCCPFLSFSIFCVWLGVLYRFCFAVFFVTVVSWNKIIGCEPLFVLSCCVLLFWGGVLLMFLFCVLAFRSRTCFGKFSCCQVFLFGGRSLSLSLSRSLLGFCSDVVLFDPFFK